MARRSRLNEGHLDSIAPRLDLRRLPDRIQFGAGDALTGHAAAAAGEVAATTTGAAGSVLATSPR